MQEFPYMRTLVDWFLKIVGLMLRSCDLCVVNDIDSRSRCCAMGLDWYGDVCSVGMTMSANLFVARCRNADMVVWTRRLPSGSNDYVYQAGEVPKSIN